MTVQTTLLDLVWKWPSLKAINVSYHRAMDNAKKVDYRNHVNVKKQIMLISNQAVLCHLPKS